MAQRKFTLTSQKITPIKGHIIGRIKLLHDGQTALVNYAGNILATIDTNTGIYGEHSDFRGGAGIGDFFPSKSSNIIAFTLFRSHDDSGCGVINYLSKATWMEERKEYYGHDIQFSTDLKMIALINGGGINIYASEDGSSIQSIPVQTHEESKVLFHPSGKMITHMNLNTLSAFKLPSAELMWEIEVSGGCGYDIWEFSHNGELFGMSNLDQASKICKSDTGEKIGLLKKGNDERVNEIHFSKDDKKIITCSYDKAIRIWDVDRSELIHKMDAAHESMDSVVTTDDFLTGVSFSSWDNTFYLWDLENGELMDKISMDFSVDDFKLISSQSKPHKLIVVGMNDYKRDSSINAVNKKPIAIQICSILF